MDLFHDEHDIGPLDQVGRYLLPFLLWLAFAFRQIERLLPAKVR
jgi:hypothetical protein